MKSFFSLFVCLANCVTNTIASVFPIFTYEKIEAPSENYRESMQIFDMDKDGDLDFTSGGGIAGKEFWFENKQGTWIRHVLHNSINDADVGAIVADFNGDGWMDLASGSNVYLHPSIHHDQEFIAVKTGAMDFTHDMFAADIDKDGKTDIVTLDYSGLYWFKNVLPDTSQLWTKTQVEGRRFDQPHGGLALGDIDNDGDIDIARVDRWFENVDGKGAQWKERDSLDFGQISSWGKSGKTRLVDLDKDGDLDLMQSDCDVPNAQVAWFENLDHGNSWSKHLIKDSTDFQDFHTLNINDFNGDGNLDILACGGPITDSVPKCYIWENLGQAKSWQEHIIYTGKTNCHEGIAGDFDGDGDLDLLCKGWLNFHYILNNQLIPSSIATKSTRAKLAPSLMKIMRNGKVIFSWEQQFRDLQGKTIPQKIDK